MQWSQNHSLCDNTWWQAAWLHHYGVFHPKSLAFCCLCHLVNKKIKGAIAVAYYNEIHKALGGLNKFGFVRHLMQFQFALVVSPTFMAESNVQHVWSPHQSFIRHQKQKNITCRRLISTARTDQTCSSIYQLLRIWSWSSWIMDITTINIILYSKNLRTIQ